jgi:integrase
MATRNSTRGTSNKLTPTKVINAKAKKDRDYKLADGEGLFLLVRKNGSKVWRQKYRFNNKEGSATFGRYPTVDLEKARGRRTDLLRQIDDNIDPAAAKRKAREEQNCTFKVIAQEWLNLMSGKWTARHRGVIERSLDSDVYPRLGDKPVSEISSKMILDTASKISDRGAHDVARRVLRRISSVMEFAAVTDRVQVNPAIGLNKYLPENKASRRHFPAITWQQLPDFTQAIDDSDMFEQTRLGLWLLLRTAVRPGELRFARWDEFDLDQKVWEIPAARMKMNQPHVVPLSDQAVAVLEQLKPLAGVSDLVLPGRSTLTKPISENTLLYAIHRVGFKDMMTAHGCRSVFSSWANEKGEYRVNGQVRPFSADSIERQLAHGHKDKVRDAYMRSDFMGERETLMQSWSDHLDQCRDTSGKVVDIKRKKSS